MNKLFVFLISCLCSFLALSQNGKKNGVSINTCAGAINVFEDGDFQLQFTGKKSTSDFDAYPSLGEVSTDNLIWVSFIANRDGQLTFNASRKSGFLQMIIFQQEENKMCEEIHEGSAEIKRIYKQTDQSIVGLDYSVMDGMMYALSLQKGKKIAIAFASEADHKDKLYLQWRFNSNAPVEIETKRVDKRDDDFAPTFSISVLDKETKLPLIANLSIEGNKLISGHYIGSEFLFNLNRNTKITLKCDVEGYFYDDRIVEVSSFEDQEVILLLDRVSAGKSMQIEEIEFVPGTSEVTKSSEPKLRRLKDFLALNADVNIEIQGHVFAMGKNSIAGQKVSEARAKRVKKYLIENGISKSRLSTVGYGNTRPIYPEPKYFYEEQANRRVEIMIK